MTRILHIDASARTSTSISRAASAKLVAGIDGAVTYRDLAANPLPHIDGAWVDARLTDPETRSANDAASLALSDSLVAEMLDADIIVIGVPLYNFGAPASLKAWMDLVARPRVTFSYKTGGPVGHLIGKRAIIAIASGGVPVGARQDFLSPHIKVFLDFLGITDVEIVAAKDIV